MISYTKLCINSDRYVRLATCFNICSAESANLVLDATDNHIFKNWFSARDVEFHLIWKFS